MVTKKPESRTSKWLLASGSEDRYNDRPQIFRSSVKVAERKLKEVSSRNSGSWMLYLLDGKSFVPYAKAGVKITRL